MTDNFFQWEDRKARRFQRMAVPPFTLFPKLFELLMVLLVIKLDKNMDKFPVIKTERLLLRQLSDDDKHAILRNFSDEAVTRWFFDEPFNEITQAEELIADFNENFLNEKGLTWAITCQGDNDVIGTCGIEPFQVGGRGEIGFDLAQSQWGKGLMSEALGAVIAFGFESLRLQGIDADTYCENKRSITLLERLGFTKLERVEDYFKFSLEQKDWSTMK
jgi:ribosomal-protein-alanine N-acetyltransferase